MPASNERLIAVQCAQIVMRDRVTGEARGFGFVTVESAAADTVERTDHIIGGRKARSPPSHAGFPSCAGAVPRHLGRETTPHTEPTLARRLT